MPLPLPLHAPLAVLLVAAGCGAPSAPVPSSKQGDFKDGGTHPGGGRLGSWSGGAACTAAQEPAYAAYVPPAGCSCAETWSYNGKVYCERTCADPDNDPNGPWCFTDGPCNGMSWAYCSPGASTPAEPPAPDCAPADPSAQGMSPPAGCTCAGQWSYLGQLQCGGRCANPDRDPNGTWCFTDGPCNGMPWAYCRR